MHSNQSNNSDHRPVYLDIFNAKVEELDKTEETILMSFEASSGTLPEDFYLSLAKVQIRKLERMVGSKDFLKLKLKMVKLNIFKFTEKEIQVIRQLHKWSVSPL